MAKKKAKKMSRRARIGAAVAAGSIATGVLAASAASLGTLDANSLGATTTVVQACQSGGLALTKWGTPVFSGAALTGTAQSNSKFTENSVNLTGVTNPGCASRSFRLAIASATGMTLAETGGTLTSSNNTTITFAAVDAETIEQATLTIYN